MVSARVSTAKIEGERGMHAHEPLTARAIRLILALMVRRDSSANWPMRKLMVEVFIASELNMISFFSELKPGSSDKRDDYGVELVFSSNTPCLEA